MKIRSTVGLIKLSFSFVCFVRFVVKSFHLTIFNAVIENDLQSRRELLLWRCGWLKKSGGFSKPDGSDGWSWWR